MVRTIHTVDFHYLRTGKSYQPEVLAMGCSVKKFLKMFSKLTKNTYHRKAFFVKPRVYASFSLERELHRTHFPKKFDKLLKTAIL